MTLTYPIAGDTRDALRQERMARTLGEAREAAGGGVALVSEWLRPAPAEAEEISALAERGSDKGFVQLYADERGDPVLAVTYWKHVTAPAKSDAPPADASDRTAGKGRSRKAKAGDEAPPPASEATPLAAPEPEGVAEDHTDDLYFSRKPRPKPGQKAKKRIVDPKQLDLFGGPDQRGAERRDPHNPFVVLVDEEGVGASFGVGAGAEPGEGEAR